MADYSISSYTADGTTTDFLMTFDYLDVTHLKVFIDGVSADDVGSGYSYSLINSTTMRVTTDLLNPVTSGKLIEIKRVTPIDTPAVTFNDGSSINGGDLNKNTNYLLFAMQESVDNIHDTVAEGAALAQVATEGFRDEAEAFRDQAAVSAAAAAASEAGVAADAAAATTAATGAASSQTAAAASATSASTSATNAASSATSASTSASAASTSATSASTSATTAGTHATNAAASATSAGNSATSASSSASSASSSASSASSSASSATTSKNSAATSASDAASSATSASSSATTANLHKLAAEAAATSATNTAAALTGFDLEAIAATKAVTAVDVFVYDTSKDSDGGAWRKRTQHTSWYNETLNTATRGARREFPAVAVIVAESNKVTIYDGDDPSLPMWMVFNVGANQMVTSGTPSSLSALNGRIVTGKISSNGMALVSLIEDAGEVVSTGGVFTYKAPVAGRNDTSGFGAASGSGIVNATVNDVAMTVLPDAPIDPATGLPVPTIAVATAGGVSVITDSGNVYDSASTLGRSNVMFDADGGLYYTRNSYSSNLAYSTPADYEAGDGFGDEIGNSVTTTKIKMLAGATNGNDLVVFDQDSIALGNGGSTSGHASPGLQISKVDLTTPGDSLSAKITSTYNTGWMPGDIKGAFLSDTDDTDLVADGLGYDDFTAYADQAAAEAAGYTFTSCTFDAANDQVDFSGVSASLNIPDGLPDSTPAIVEITVSNYVSGSAPLQNDYVAQTAFSGASALNSNGTHKFYIPAIGFLRISTTNFNASIDAISVKLSDEDRSVNSVGLIVNGTVTRTAVATGADLVAYSGFSASNYLEQPYNSDLDFGTGDFCVMGWVKDTSTATALYVDRRGASLAFYLAGVDNDYSFKIVGATLTDTSGVRNNGSWNFVCVKREGGVGYIFVNGIQTASQGSMGGDVNIANAALGVGAGVNGASSAASASLALLRISATAPTAEQIAKIYEDEKVLFQENAACTLYGASDAVTALAHDSDTGLLHVGTSAGRSVFQGLRRVSNTTTAVGTAISASNNLIVEE